MVSTLNSPVRCTIITDTYRFVCQRVSDGCETTANPASMEESMAMALEALDALRTHKAFVVGLKS